MSEPEAAFSSSSVRAARDVVVIFSRLRRRLREVAGPDELTASQTSVLARLSKEGPSSTSGLAALEKVRPQSMAATVAGLESRALIARGPDPDDGRRQVISLTTTGREVADGSRRARHDWLVRAFEERFDESERLTINDALDLLDRLTES